MRRRDRFGWNLERQLGDEQRMERVARYVDAFPKRSGAEQDRLARVAKTVEQNVARFVAVHEQRPPSLDASRAQLSSHCANVTVAREEHEHAAVGCFSQVKCHAS